jgi:four helix bundle protein
MKDSVLRTKSFDFAVRVVKMARWLQNEKKEYVVGKQLLKAGTAVGALVSEAAYGQSKADFISKMSIALKEAHETSYWIKLMVASEIITQDKIASLSSECDELISMLVSSIKTAKGENK